MPYNPFSPNPRAAPTDDPFMSGVPKLPKPRDLGGNPPLDPRAAPGYRGPTGGPAPDPYSTWFYGDQDDRSWRYVDTATRQYYESNPQQLWLQYTKDMFGDRETPQVAYARSRYAQAWADYLRASEGEGNTMQWVDYADNNLANQIRQSFQMQTPSAKGYAIAWQPQGRYTG